MAQELTRQELHTLVWSQPMQKLAKQFGLSDRGLAKICTAAGIPVPARGYWAKLQAGHKVSPCPLPPRGFGQLDRVSIGRSQWPYDRESDSDILNAPIPPTPVFEPDMETVRAEVTALVRSAPLPLRDGGDWHSQITKLLAADDDRARKQQASPYPSLCDGPIFNTAFESRRMRILNALFTCLTRCEMTPHLSGKQGRELSVTVGDILAHFTLDAASAAKQLDRERQGYSFVARGEKDRMRLSLSSLWSVDPNPRSWEDGQGNRLERQLREIVVEMIVSGEQRVRKGAVGRRDWLIQRKAELQEEERKREIEEERQRRARQTRLGQARIDHLLAQAQAFDQAAQIRAYVARVHQINDEAPDPMTSQALDEWARWALAQAARIDPVVSGAYKTRPAEPSEDEVPRE